MFQLGFIVALLFCLIGCNKNPTDSQDLYCTIDQTQTYQVNVDPGSDFNVTEIRREIDFSNVTCPNFDPSFNSKIISRVQRQGEKLTITENTNSIFERKRSFMISGSNIIPETDTANTKTDCLFITSWTGELDTTNNRVIIKSSNEYRGRCARFFPTQPSH